jgi:sec-independent protein translocase protein TatC
LIAASIGDLMSVKESEEMSFWDHLTELLSRLKRVLYALIISTLVVMLVPISIDFENLSLSDPFYMTITSVVIRDLQERFLNQNIGLIPISFFAPLEVYTFISVIIGASVSLPVVAYELYKFFSPALFKHEKGFALKFLGSFMGLFSFGLVLGYLYIVPMTFQTMLVFANLLDLTLIYHFTEFFSLVGTILLMCGLIFTFPIYIYLLVKAGILKTQQLTQNRKYLYGGALLLIAVLDPDPTLITETLTFIPFIILMEISIFISKRVERSRETAASN